MGNTMYKHNVNGFTLIELMIVVVVIAIIAGIAVPNYQGYLEQARRADGQAALLELANALERNFTVTGRYDRFPDGTDMDIVTLVGDDTVGESSVYYNLSFNTPSATNAPTATRTLTRTTFTLHAYPAGVQSGDKCGVLRLTSAGVRDAIRLGTVESNCWR